MVLLGFAWLLSTLEAANSPLLYTLGLTVNAAWGSVFVHLGMASRPAGPASRRDRALVLVASLVFPLAPVPALLLAGPEERV